MTRIDEDIKDRLDYARACLSQSSRDQEERDLVSALERIADSLAMLQAAERLLDITAHAAGKGGE